jgi:hypothetical protein
MACPNPKEAAVLRLCRRIQIPSLSLFQHVWLQEAMVQEAVQEPVQEPEQEAEQEAYRPTGGFDPTRPWMPLSLALQNSVTNLVWNARLVCAVATRCVLRSIAGITKRKAALFV